jgi:hypothetical protein
MKDKIIVVSTNNTAAVLIITALFLSIIFKFIYLILMPFCLDVR